MFPVSLCDDDCLGLLLSSWVSETTGQCSCKRIRTHRYRWMVDEVIYSSKVHGQHWMFYRLFGRKTINSGAHQFRSTVLTVKLRTKGTRTRWTLNWVSCRVVWLVKYCFHDEGEKRKLDIIRSGKQRSGLCPRLLKDKGTEVAQKKLMDFF